MKKVLKFSILLMVMFACKRESVDYIGPAYISAPDDFSVTSFTASLPAVDFTSTTETFNATFTHNVSWVLTVTGQASGAVFETTGISNNISAVWTGTNNSVTFFRTGETVTATLSFYNSKYISSINVDITQVPNFIGSTYAIALFGDFEDTAKVYDGVRWSEFDKPNPIPNVDQGIDSMAIDYNGKIVPSCQGKKYYYIKGLGNQPTFVSGLRYFGLMAPILPATPDNIWVNMYVYGTGDANSAIELEYQEADFDGTSFGYTPTDDDAFVAYISLSHKGWKLFSFKYSELTPSLNKDFGGNGNKIHEPNRLKAFDLILTKKSNPNKPVEVYFDFPIITVGGPFDPSK